MYATKPFLLILFLSSFSFFANSQNFLISNGDFDSCSGTFFDSGGTGVDYGPNENYTITICSDASTGTHVSLLFSGGVALGAGDEICFFDGMDTSSPLSCSADFEAGAAFIIQATAANTSGCLTITFTSDGSGEGPGWSALISCVAACQTIEALLSSTSPMIMPADTGWIDICPGDAVSFVGTGNYPQDGLVYNHSDFTSSFSWDFGDGTGSVGPTAYHIFDEPGGYIVQLTIEDQFGCRNTNFITQRIRVSTYPNFELSEDIPDVICSGDTVTLVANVNLIDSLYEVSVSPTEGSFPNGGVVSDSLPLPDGTGVAYETSIEFTEFSPGQVLTDINDLLGICVIMEHSYLHDLQIELVCPDGTSVVLQQQVFQGQCFLGIPNEADEGMNPPLQGTGWEYCWTPDATNGNWTEYYNAENVGTIPEGDYSAFGNLEDFLGCPLNGAWTIIVQDLWAIDNGWIFEWSIDFNPAIYPSIETFTPILVDYQWNPDPSIIYYSDDSITAAPANAGVASYTFEVMDDFGCTYDTTVNINVLPPNDPECYNCSTDINPLEDLVICGGTSTIIDGTAISALTTQEVTYGASPNAVIENDVAPPISPFESTVTISNISPPILTDPLNQIASVCVNIEHSAAGDLEIYLRAPDGTIMELSTDNGFIFDDYINTCFTPTAILSIVAGAPPFTGAFLPEGDWTSLTGVSTNGDWTLLVSDDAGGFDGVFMNWEISFVNENAFTFSWEGTDMSCTDCPDPEVSPSVTTDYIVVATDNFNCFFTDTLTVSVLDAIEAPQITCSSDNNTNELTFSWLPIAGATQYEISLDGGATWEDANGLLSHVLSGLSNGETVDIQVRVKITAGDCDAIAGLETCSLIDCLMTIDTNFVMHPTCFNGNEGSVLVSASNGLPPINFSVNGGLPQMSNSFSDLTAGDYAFVAVDAEGCTDTIHVTLNNPDSIVIDIVVDSVSCNGGMDGQAVATATGGSNNFTYTWLTVPSTNGQTLSGVEVGTYIVSITDVVGTNSCSFTDTIEIFEPSALSVTAVQDSVSCGGLSDGSASAIPLGGVAPYTYLWDDNQTDSTAIGLTAGTYTPTITDANGCTAFIPVEVLEPEILSLVINPTDILCNGDSTGMIDITVSGGVTPYSFDWGNGNDTEDLVNVSAGTYLGVVTDANGCSITTNPVILSEPTAISMSSVVNDVSCSGTDDGSIDVTVLGGETPYTFAWDNSEITEDLAGLAPGAYVLTITDDNLCEFIADTIFVINQSPIEIVGVVTDVSCNGGADGAIDITVTGSQPPYTFVWSDGSTTEDVSDLSAIADTVTVTDDNGCMATASFVINEPTLLTLTTTDTDAACLGEASGSAVVTPSGGTAPYTYQWTDNQSDSIATGIAAGLISVVVTDALGCMANADVTVGEPATAVSSLTSQTLLGCADENSSEAVVSVTGGTGPYTYDWANGSNDSTAVALDNISYTVTIADANGCEIIDAILISELEPITANIIHVEPSCFGDSDGQLGVNIVDGGIGVSDPANYTYAWNTTPIQFANDIANLAGNESYTVTISDTQGCTGTESFDLGQPSPIILSLDQSDVKCFAGDDGQATVSAQGDHNDYTYEWDFNTGSQTTATAISLSAGNYFVIVTDSTNCSAATSLIITQPSIIQADFTEIDNDCPGQTNGGLITDVQGGVPGYTYNWSNGDTTASLDSLYSDWFTVTITDANDCVHVDSALVSQPPPIEATPEGFDVTCFGDDDGYFDIATIGGTPPFAYSINDFDYYASNRLIGLESGDYTIYIQDATGCTFELEGTIGTPDEFLIDAGEDVEIYLGDSIRLLATPINPAEGSDLYYEWIPEFEGDTSLYCKPNNPSCDAPYSSTYTTMNYTVYSVDANGCEAFDDVIVTVLKPRKIMVPTAFTPNGDGMNDLLLVHGASKNVKIINTYKVFDRWGELVYQSNNFMPNDARIGWNGNFNGREMNSGVYIWYVEVEYIDGFTELLKGNTTLLR